MLQEIPFAADGRGTGMQILSNVFPVQYAVIQFHKSEGGTERFVMEYQDERALRQLLDKRSILATGFVSRDEATKESLTAEVENRRPLFSLACAFRVSLGFCLRLLKMRTLCRLQGRDIALGAMSNVVHLASAALHKIQSRLRNSRRRLEAAVQ